MIARPISTRIPAEALRSRVKDGSYPFRSHRTIAEINAGVPPHPSTTEALA